MNEFVQEEDVRQLLDGRNIIVQKVCCLYEIIVLGLFNIIALTTIGSRYIHVVVILHMWSLTQFYQRC